MAWSDGVLLSALPLLIVMSALAVALPAARPARPWAGVGLAWLVAFVAGTLTALASTDSWTLDCTFRIFRTGVSSGISLGDRPCTGANELSPWLLALPPTLGIGVLLAWTSRHTRPFAEAVRTALILVSCAAVVVAIGQINANLALLVVVALIVGSYAWAYVRDEVMPSRRVRPGT